MAVKDKPQYNFINITTLETDILNVIYKSLNLMGFDKSGIDYTNPKKPRFVSHNQLNYCFRQVYKELFKPDKPLFNNQNSIINYDDNNILKLLADVFINICDMYNKSLGLMSFSYMTGINTDTLIRWTAPEAEKLNPTRCAIVKYIREGHKAAQIGLLNESPVGALAVANNDTETGLEWATKQAITAGQQTVFLIPSERVNRLQLTTEGGPALPGPEISGDN